MKPLFYSILILSLIFSSCTKKEDKVCIITGTVMGVDTKSISLIKPTQDTRFDSIIEIPVIDGRFYYEKKLQNPEAVDLAFTESVNEGAYRPMPLFLENDSINLTIYKEEEFDKNVIEGGCLNAEYKKYKNTLEAKFNPRRLPIQDSLRELIRTDKYHSEEMKSILAELSKAKNHNQKLPLYKKQEDLRKSGLDLSPVAKKLTKKSQIIHKEFNDLRQEYIDRNPNIISYSFLLKDLVYNKETIDINLAKSNYKKLTEANPKHPYNDLAFNLIEAIDNIKVGKKYIDFSAPDLKDNIVNLSDEIKGKVALLDLWATWCGPCIAKSRTMIPVYNDYRDKEFIILGVAGEFKNTNRLTKFLQKEKWPWLNLVELDKQNKIWQKYNVDGSGGGMFLIDKNGEILAKDPTAEEVKSILEELL